MYRRIVATMLHVFLCDLNFHTDLKQYDIMTISRSTLICSIIGIYLFYSYCLFANFNFILHKLVCFLYFDFYTKKQN